MRPDGRPCGRKTRAGVKNWRVGELLSEALRDLTASWPRTLVLCVATAAMAGALAWSELATTDGILSFQRDFEDAGGNVLVASSPVGVSASACVALAERAEVAAAGAAWGGEVSEPNVAPGTMFQTQRLTTGTFEVWGAPISGVASLGIVVGSAAASEIGLTDGAPVGILGETPLPVTVVDIERRGPESQRSFLIPSAPIGRADVCWVEMDPGSVTGGEVLAQAVFADAGPDLSVRPLVRLGDFARDPLAELRNRPQAQAWTAAGGLLVLLVWLDLWFRRGALSLYRVLGTTRSGLLVLTQAGLGVVMLVAATAGVLWASATHAAATGLNATADQYLVAARTVASALALALVAGPLPALLTGGRGVLLSQLKDR